MVNCIWILYGFLSIIINQYFAYDTNSGILDPSGYEIHIMYLKRAKHFNFYCNEDNECISPNLPLEPIPIFADQVTTFEIYGIILSKGIIIDKLKLPNIKFAFSAKHINHNSACDEHKISQLFSPYNIEVYQQVTPNFVNPLNNLNYSNAFYIFPFKSLIDLSLPPLPNMNKGISFSTCIKQEGVYVISKMPNNITLSTLKPNYNNLWIYNPPFSWLEFILLKAHSRYIMPYLSLQIILIVICFFVSGLFSGLTIGLLSLDPNELKILINSGSPKERKYASVISPLRSQGSFLLCTLVLANVLVNSSLTILLENLSSGKIAVIVSTIGITIFGEIVPQALCTRHGLAIGAHTIYLTKTFMYLTAPLSYPLSLILDHVLGREIGSIYDRQRLVELVKMMSGGYNPNNNNFNNNSCNNVAGSNNRSCVRIQITDPQEQQEQDLEGEEQQKNAANLDVKFISQNRFQHANEDVVVEVKQQQQLADSLGKPVPNGILINPITPKRHCNSKDLLVKTLEEHNTADDTNASSRYSSPDSTTPFLSSLKMSSILKPLLSFFDNLPTSPSSPATHERPLPIHNKKQLLQRLANEMTGIPFKDDLNVRSEPIKNATPAQDNTSQEEIKCDPLKELTKINRPHPHFNKAHSVDNPTSIHNYPNKTSWNKFVKKKKTSGHYQHDASSGDLKNDEISEILKSSKISKILSNEVSRRKIFKFIDAKNGKGGVDKEIKSTKSKGSRHKSEGDVGKVVLQKVEVDIITGALDMSAKKVGDIMTPLKNIFALGYQSILDFDTMASIVNSGYTRIPVYQEPDRASIVGLLNFKDLAFIDPDDKIPLATILKFYNHAVTYVFEDTPLFAILNEFKKGKSHMAFVRRVVIEEDKDPSYKIVGLLTLEDVLEEIIQSEIWDETDSYNRMDNKGRHIRKRNHSLNLFWKPNSPIKSSYTLSPQMALVAFQYLRANIDAFNEERVSGPVLRKLIRRPSVVVHYSDKLSNLNRSLDNNTDSSIKSSGSEPQGSKCDPSKRANNIRHLPIYEKGTPADYFILILEGRVRVFAGKENICFETGPFNYFGIQALEDHDSNVVPVTADISKASIVGDTPICTEKDDEGGSEYFVPDYTVLPISCKCQSGGLHLTHDTNVDALPCCASAYEGKLIYLKIRKDHYQAVIKATEIERKIHHPFQFIPDTADNENVKITNVVERKDTHLAIKDPLHKGANQEMVQELLTLTPSHSPKASFNSRES